jgi:hypothetical protein
MHLSPSTSGRAWTSRSCFSLATQDRASTSKLKGWLTCWYYWDGHMVKSYNTKDNILGGHHIQADTFWHNDRPCVRTRNVKATAQINQRDEMWVETGIRSSCSGCHATEQTLSFQSRHVFLLWLKLPLTFRVRWDSISTPNFKGWHLFEELEKYDFFLLGTCT